MEKGEEKEVDAVLLLLLLAWIRGKAYTVVSTLINRIVEAIETRAGRTVARIATRRPLPSPSPRAEVGSMDRFNAEFNVLCSVFERFGAIRRRGSRTNTPSSSNPRSRCPVPSLYPSIRPAPPSSSPPLSIRLPGLWTANTPGGSTHLRPNERPTEPTYPFCLPIYPSTYLSPLIHSLLSASGIPNWWIGRLTTRATRHLRGRKRREE